MELSYENSLQQAAIITQIKNLLLALDVEYLKSAAKQMRKDNSFRESAMILNPSPLTAFEQQELDAAKLRQLEIYINAIDNMDVIAKAEMKLGLAKVQSQQIGKMFGIINLKP